MPALSHAKTNPVADFTGTVTVLNSAGATTSIAATDLVRPSDWNSAHSIFQTITGNTAGSSTLAGSNIVYGGSNVTLSASTDGAGSTIWWKGQPANTLSDLIYPDHQGATYTRFVNGSVYVRPFSTPQDLVASRWDIPVSLSLGSQTNNSSAYFDLSIWAGIYTMVNATSLASYATTSRSYTFTWSSNNYANSTGLRQITNPWNITLTPGQYWLGLALSTTNSATGGANTTALGNSVSFFIHATTALATALAAVCPIGVAIGNSNSDNFGRFFGFRSNTTNGTWANIAASDISNGGTAFNHGGVVVRFRNI